MSPCTLHTHMGAAHLKGLKVAVVDAKHAVCQVQLQDTLKLCHAVHLNEALQPHLQQVQL